MMEDIKKKDMDKEENSNVFKDFDQFFKITPKGIVETLMATYENMKINKFFFITQGAKLLGNDPKYHNYILSENDPYGKFDLSNIEKIMHINKLTCNQLNN